MSARSQILLTRPFLPSYEPGGRPVNADNALEGVNFCCWTEKGIEAWVKGHTAKHNYLHYHKQRARGGPTPPPSIPPSNPVNRAEKLTFLAVVPASPVATALKPKTDRNQEPAPGRPRRPNTERVVSTFQVPGISNASSSWYSPGYGRAFCTLDCDEQI